MANRRKSAGRKAPHPARVARNAMTASARLKDTWYATLGALTSAEENLEKQVRRLLKRNKVSTRDASAMLKDVGALIGRDVAHEPEDDLARCRTKPKVSLS